MEETIEYWQLKLSEYQEALESELQMDDRNDDMVKLLKNNIEECLKQLQ